MIIDAWYVTTTLESCHVQLNTKHHLMVLGLTCCTRRVADTVGFNRNMFINYSEHYKNCSHVIVLNYSSLFLIYVKSGSTDA